MTVFKFRMLSDENDHFVRDYEVPFDMTLLAFHEFIRESLGYEQGMVSFFTADERWEKGQEYTLLEMGESSENAPLPMAGTTLGQIMRRNRDRLIYLFDLFAERAYYLELTGTQQTVAGVTYPREAFAHGEVPDQYDPSAVEAGGSIFDEMMGDFSEFEGVEGTDDGY